MIGEGGSGANGSGADGSGAGGSGAGSWAARATALAGGSLLSATKSLAAAGSSAAVASEWGEDGITRLSSFCACVSSLSASRRWTATPACRATSVLVAAFPLRRNRPNPERIPSRATVSALRHHGTDRSVILAFPAACAARFPRSLPGGPCFARRAQAFTVLSGIFMASRTSTMVCSARCSARREPSFKISMACGLVIAVRRS